MQTIFCLADIVREFDLVHLHLIKYKLMETRCDYRHLRGTNTRPLEKAELDFIAPVVTEILEYCEKVGFRNGQDAAYALTMKMSHLSSHDSSSMFTDLDNLDNQLIRDEFEHTFIQISGERRRYANRTQPLGKDVAAKFPSAESDLIEAGNCLAVECNTAAAFHLMRAAEVGLWELGRDRQIPLAKSGKIEFSQWGTIIGELEEAVKNIQQWTNSAIKEEAHKFYNSSVVEIRSFNDGWRRHADHARPHMPRMESDEALALWGHVFRFMTKLATKIGEGQYTKLVWAQEKKERKKR